LAAHGALDRAIGKLAPLVKSTRSSVRPSQPAIVRVALALVRPRNLSATDKAAVELAARRPACELMPTIFF
jgi:hypothetical protein